MIRFYQVGVFGNLFKSTHKKRVSSFFNFFNFAYGLIALLVIAGKFYFYGITVQGSTHKTLGDFNILISSFNNNITVSVAGYVQSSGVNVIIILCGLIQPN